MTDAQFRSASQNYPSAKRLWFKWTMLSATTFAINRAAEFLAGTSAIVRTGTGVYDFFPQDPPGAGLLSWWFGIIAATPGGVVLAGTGITSIVNSLTSSSKITATFRRGDTGAATDLAAGDIVHGYFDIMTVVL